MKCTSCGLPLSPSRPNRACPRCGTPTKEAGRKAATTPAQQYYEQTNRRGANMFAGGGILPLQNDSWGQSTPAPVSAWWTQEPLSNPAETASPPQHVPASSSLQNNPPAWFSVPPPSPVISSLPYEQPFFQVQPSRNRLALLIAGLCVITGGLILMVVFLISRSLPSSGSSSTNTSNANSSQSTSISTGSSTSPIAALPSPTALPGQQYINNVQMASAIDANEKATQLSTTFKVNSKMYVTFQVHPAGHTGAVCLLWYLNGKPVTAYQFPVSSSSNGGRYSYAIYGETGPAYVEIYWASSTACADKILAEHVNFTVTP